MIARGKRGLDALNVRQRDSGSLEVRPGLTGAMEGCYPEIGTPRPLERPVPLVFDLLSRRFRDRERYGDRLPPGQKVVGHWPVLTYAATPQIDLDKWRLRIYGAVQREAELTWEQLRALPTAAVTCDIHCVTSWSRMDNHFEGVLLRDLLGRFPPLPSAKSAMVHCYGGYRTNVPLADLMREDALLAYKHDGKDLTPAHGWPLRLVIPHLYFWKSAKWVRALEFMEKEQPGFWEVHGYHMRGDPWKEERYS
jgi:DMSO/TMAO reductase YedYZ molybdopterin-dependent catalytic subunit